MSHRSKTYVVWSLFNFFIIGLSLGMSPDWVFGSVESGTSYVPSHLVYDVKVLVAASSGAVGTGRSSSSGTGSGSPSTPNSGVGGTPRDQGSSGTRDPGGLSGSSETGSPGSGKSGRPPMTNRKTEGLGSSTEPMNPGENPSR